MYAMFAVNGEKPFCLCSTRVCIERVANAKCIQKRHSLVGHDGRQRINGSIMCVGVFFGEKYVLSSNVILFVLIQQHSVKYWETRTSTIVIRFLLFVVSHYDAENKVLRIMRNTDIYGFGICCLLLLLSMILRMRFWGYWEVRTSNMLVRFVSCCCFSVWYWESGFEKTL